MHLMSFSQPIAVKDWNMECLECGRVGTVHVGVHEKEKFELRILAVNKMKGKTFVLFIPATTQRDHSVLWKPKRGGPYVNPFLVWAYRCS